VQAGDCTEEHFGGAEWKGPTKWDAVHPAHVAFSRTLRLGKALLQCPPPGLRPPSPAASGFAFGYALTSRTQERE
jgi:hypothetical protein